MYGGKFAFQNRLGWPYSWNRVSSTMDAQKNRKIGDSELRK